MQRRLILGLFASGAAAALAGCSHFESKAAPTERAVIPVDADLTISRDAAGNLKFKYNAPFSDEDGNFDFTKGEAEKASVILSFTIADDSGLGLLFRRDGRDAIWIVEKTLLAYTGATSPQGPYDGKQFRDFKISADGKTLTLFDENSDGILYRYALRFNMGSEVVAHDPDVSNGGHGGGN